MTTDAIAEATLSGLLASALGEERAEQAVRRHLVSLEISHRELSPAEAISVLRAIGEEPGLVGITARFAASRMILRWGVDA